MSLKINNVVMFFLSLTLLFIIFTGCTKNSTEKAILSKENGREDGLSEKSLFSIDINIRKELILYDEQTNSIYAYFRIKHNFIPLKSEKNVLAGKLTFRGEEPLSDLVYRVRIAGAPKPETISVEDIKKLRFGYFSLNPSTKMITGFNEIDAFGSGSCDIIAELLIKPEEEIPNLKSAEEYLKDLSYDGKIKFSYELLMDRPDNKQLYRKVEIKVPEQVFSSNNEIFLFSVQL